MAVHSLGQLLDAELVPEVDALDPLLLALEPEVPEPEPVVPVLDEVSAFLLDESELVLLSELVLAGVELLDDPLRLSVR